MFSLRFIAVILCYFVLFILGWNQMGILADPVCFVDKQWKKTNSFDYVIRLPSMHFTGHLVIT